MTSIRPPTVTVSLGPRTVDVDTGELLFPVLVLAFCLYYWWDTIGLPDLSMLYAGPLLYATAALAVLTILLQAVSVDDGTERSREPTATHAPEPEPGPHADSEEDAALEAADRESPFTVRNAIALVALTAGYIVALEPVGFLAATVVFLATTLFLFGERNPVAIAAYSIGFAFVVWLVFVYWLMVPL
ncbi:tripartite tricarboxylate transporter TctB family protein [Natrarchaeobaculum aegyptiacum]|uniref:DUF1468 domain-containing protein n=1 Tax=Natrarchaeobaculum aegyptiacum TaxID=745377 RepID=A0A2Z2HN65_9EURY|nr:tripartite tricarboxylate transporter TctB family protein [Natrarchaeobaculum aegyptiacum]ARS88346.1 hypothetical protein B1756_00295 [Natrarchaeobaculum aegyptiacum]